LINVPGLITGNEIQQDRESGIYLFGSRSVVRQNRIHGSAIGLVADSSQGAIIEQNEIDGAGQVGLLVRNSRNTLVLRNRLYSNAYGVAAVFGSPPNPDVFDDNLVLANRFDGLFIVGASPLIRHNDVLDNRGAAARVLDFVPWEGPRVVAQPRLESNTFRANLVNEAVRGEYRPRREEEP
jgi:parallel beta-helix repeat protein